jgi:hypothetical protein
VEAASHLLASGYTSTMLGIAGLSLLACVSLLMTVKAISDLEQGNLPGTDVATALRSLKF